MQSVRQLRMAINTPYVGGVAEGAVGRAGRIAPLLQADLPGSVRDSRIMIDSREHPQITTLIKNRRIINQQHRRQIINQSIHLRLDFDFFSSSLTTTPYSQQAAIISNDHHVPLTALHNSPHATHARASTFHPHVVDRFGRTLCCRYSNDTGEL